MKHWNFGHKIVSPYTGAEIHLSRSSAMGGGYYGNTLTGLIPDMFDAMDVVSRELVGYIPGVMRNTGAERAAVGQNVTYHVAPSANIADITPAMTVPNPTDQTIGAGSLVITASKAAEFGFVGEEQRGLNSGPGALSVQGDMIAQALRGLANLIETSVAGVAHLGASRALAPTGSAVLFDTNVGDAAQGRKILDDNGTPLSDRSLVIDTSAGASLRTLMQLTKVNEAGTSMTLRDGQLLDLHGMSIRESAQAVQFTKGTAASSTTDNAGYAVGATVITLASAGTGAIKAGDVIAFAGDSNLYVVASGDADVSGGGTITLAAPGLRQALAASATAITVSADYSANVAFARSAIQLVTRAPALPDEGDVAMERFILTDPRSGLTFEVSVYGGYRKVRYEVAIAWGQKVVKPEHIALLMNQT